MKLPLMFIICAIVSGAIGIFIGQTQVTKSQTEIKSNNETTRQTVIVKDKDGREVTTIKEHITTTEVSKQIQQVGVKRSKINISALVGTEFTRLQPIYGLHVSKEFLGPITLGIAYINSYDGLIFISGGVNF